MHRYGMRMCLRVRANNAKIVRSVVCSRDAHYLRSFSSPEGTTMVYGWRLNTGKTRDFFVVGVFFLQPTQTSVYNVNNQSSHTFKVSLELEDLAGMWCGTIKPWFNWNFLFVLYLTIALPRAKTKELRLKFNQG